MTGLELVIRGADLVTPTGIQRADLAVAGERVVALAAEIGERGAVEIDAAGCRVVPGMIDARVRFNEPGRTDWEGFVSGSAAAAAGGVTTVFDMPMNASPPTVTPAAFLAKRALAASKSVVRVRLWGGLVPGRVDQLQALHACGVVGFTACLSSSGNDEFPRVDERTLREGMRIIARLPRMRLAVHAEDEAMTQSLAEKARRSGRTRALDYADSRPIAAEVTAIRRVLDVAGETGCRMHLASVSSAEGLDAVVAARRRGVDVTAETCPHYLAFSTLDFETLGTLAKSAPPLREPDDRDRLWAAVRARRVNFITSDHSPCPAALKSAHDFFDAWTGISGVQHSLPLLYSEGEARGLRPEDVARLLSQGPAEVFHLGPHEGRLEIGAPADFCLLGQAAAGEHVTPDELQDRHQHSPYVGRAFPWRVRGTWVGGRRVR